MSDQPVFDVLSCTFGEALGIYLYAHRQIDDPRDVGQAEVIRGKRHSADPHPFTDYGYIAYITRGANSERRTWEVAASPDEFAFDLQQTLARYAAGLVDAEVAAAKAEMEAMREANRLAEEKSLSDATQGVGDTWAVSPDPTD